MWTAALNASVSGALLASDGQRHNESFSLVTRRRFTDFSEKETSTEEKGISLSTSVPRFSRASGSHGEEERGGTWKERERESERFGVRQLAECFLARRSSSQLSFEIIVSRSRRYFLAADVVVRRLDARLRARVLQLEAGTLARGGGNLRCRGIAFFPVNCASTLSNAGRIWLGSTVNWVTALSRENEQIL